MKIEPRPGPQNGSFFDKCLIKIQWKSSSGQPGPENRSRFGFRLYGPPYMHDRSAVHTAELNPGTQNGPKLRGLFVWYEYLMMSQFACPGLFSITMQGSPYLGDLQRYLKTWLSASSSSSIRLYYKVLVCATKY